MKFQNVGSKFFLYSLSLLDLRFPCVGLIPFSSLSVIFYIFCPSLLLHRVLFHFMPYYASALISLLHLFKPYLLVFFLPTVLTSNILCSVFSSSILHTCHSQSKSSTFLFYCYIYLSSGKQYMSTAPSWFRSIFLFSSVIALIQQITTTSEWHVY